MDRELQASRYFFFSCFFKFFLACFVLGRKSTLHFTRICEFQGSPVPGNVWAEAGQSLGKETVGTDEQHQYFPTRGKYRALEGEKQFPHLYEITQKMRNLLFFFFYYLSVLWVRGKKKPSEIRYM